MSMQVVKTNSSMIFFYTHHSYFQEINLWDKKKLIFDLITI